MHGYDHAYGGPHAESRRRPGVAGDGGGVAGRGEQLGFAAQAVRAGPARHVPGQNDVLTGADGADLGAHLGDDPRALVAEGRRHQRRDGPVSQRHVAMAQADGVQSNPHLVRADGPQRQLFDGRGLPGLPQRNRPHAATAVIHVIPTYDGGRTAPGQGH